jgi:hypothetical protein
MILWELLCFLIAFNLLVNLPNNIIANPIKELTTYIQELPTKKLPESTFFTTQ